MNGIACALVGLCVSAFACTGNADAVSCAVDADCVQGEACVGGACSIDQRLCPTLQPTFTSINTALFQVSCGSKTSGCHSAGSLVVGKLDLESDPFVALLGDGTGALASMATGRPAGLRQVKPGDADQSFLVQKLLIQTPTPALGEGMPPATPRAVCSEAVEVVRAWINNGAARN